MKLTPTFELHFVYETPATMFGLESPCHTRTRQRIGTTAAASDKNAAVIAVPVNLLRHRYKSRTGQHASNARKTCREATASPTHNPPPFPPAPAFPVTLSAAMNSAQAIAPNTANIAAGPSVSTVAIAIGACGNVIVTSNAAYQSSVECSRSLYPATTIQSASTS